MEAIVLISNGYSVSRVDTSKDINFINVYIDDIISVLKKNILETKYYEIDDFENLGNILVSFKIDQVLSGEFNFYINDIIKELYSIDNVVAYVSDIFNIDKEIDYAAEFIDISVSDVQENNKYEDDQKVDFWEKLDLIDEFELREKLLERVGVEKIKEEFISGLRNFFEDAYFILDI